ncbi:MAG: transcriptional regulator GcvA [Azospirillaceae bacterium]|nr:transcriptional regulator GcvA [Azospirillaceae bacterium]
MATRLPPLNAVRVFEAAARHLSFTRAADELHVTQAAVSHQIKALEDWLGIALFRRLNRALTLTEAGRQFLPGVQGGLQQIADATRLATGGDHGGRLTVSTYSSFAARWLVPRLPRFQAAHPEIDVLLQTSSHRVDFTREDVDVAIRFGRGGWPGLYAERMFGNEVFPVCSPALLQGPIPLRAPADLRHFTLLHDDFEVDWADWLRVAGVADVDTGRGPQFTDSSLVIQLAVAGHGIALARSVICADDLAAGRLVRPFELALTVDITHWFVCPPRALERPKVAAFHRWLRAEAAATGSPDPPDPRWPDRIA